MAVSRKADLETYVDTFVTRMRVGLVQLKVAQDLDGKRIALVLLALVAWVFAPLIAAVMYLAGGPLSRQRVEAAADHADRTLNALTGNPVGVWLSQGAANNTGPGWRVLAALLEAGWPGHIEQFKQGS